MILEYISGAKSSIEEPLGPVKKIESFFLISSANHALAELGFWMR